MTAHSFSSIRDFESFTRTSGYKTANTIALNGADAQYISKAFNERQKILTSSTASSFASAGGVLAATAALVAAVAAAPIVIAGAAIAITAAEVNRLNNNRRETEFMDAFPWGEFTEKLRVDGWKITSNRGDSISLSRSV